VRIKSNAIRPSHTKRSSKAPIAVSRRGGAADVAVDVEMLIGQGVRARIAPREDRFSALMDISELRKDMNASRKRLAAARREIGDGIPW
jgi:hypothetical protein